MWHVETLHTLKGDMKLNEIHSVATNESSKIAIVDLFKCPGIPNNANSAHIP